MADNDEGGGLAGAEVVGGAVVEITGDLSGLEAAEKKARAVAERIDGTTATLKFRADDAELGRVFSAADRLTAGGKGLTIVPRIDEAAVLRASQALLDKVRDQWASLVIVPRVEAPRAGFTLPGSGPGGTFASATAAGGATLPSGGHGPGGGFVSAAAPGTTAAPPAPAWSAPTPAPSQAARPYYPAAPRTHVPREFTRRGIEQTLVGAYHAQGGGFTAQDEERLNEAAGSGDPWTFQGELPAEVKEFLERDDLPRPARRKLRNLFRVTQTVGRGGGADALGDLGEDEYFRMAEQVGGSDARAAVGHAATSDDPELQYLANLHASLPQSTTAGQARRLRRKADAADDPARRRSMLERADRLDRRAANEAEELEALPAGKLEDGQAFTVFGREHRVDRNEDDELRLTNGEGLDVPVEGLRHVLADAGSVRRHEYPGEEGGSGEPPVVVAAAAAGGPPPGRPGRGRAGAGEPIVDYGRRHGPVLENGEFRAARWEQAQLDALVTYPPGEHGPRQDTGEFTAAGHRQAARERDVVGRLRGRAVGSGADADRFDAQVGERVDQGAGRVAAAREVEAEYRRAAAAAKKEADAGEKAAAAASAKAEALAGGGYGRQHGPRLENGDFRSGRWARGRTVTDYGPDHGPRLEDGAFTSTTGSDARGIEEEAEQLARDRGYARGGLSGGGSGEVRGGSGGHGRGGSGRNYGGNLFSLRGLGRSIGSVTGAFVAVEATRIAGDFVSAYRTGQDAPQEVLASLSHPGQLHDPVYDPQLRRSAAEIGRLQANQQRLDSFKAIPLLGSTVVSLFDSLTGASAFNARRMRETTQGIELHEAGLANVDQQARELADLSYNPGDALRVAADQRETAAFNDTLRAPRDPVLKKQYDNALHLSLVDNATADRLDAAKPTVQGLTAQSLDEQGRAVAAARSGSPITAANLEAMSGYADLQKQFADREAKTVNPVDRKIAQGEDAQSLANFAAKAGVTEQQLYRQQDSAVVGFRGEQTAAGHQLDVDRAERSHDALGAFDAGRAQTRASASAQALGQIISAGGNATLQREAITTAEKQFGTYQPDATDPTKGTFAGGGTLDADTAAQRQQLLEQEEAEKTRLTAEAAANRLRIVHDATGAELKVIDGLRDEAGKIADVSVRTATLDKLDSDRAVVLKQAADEREGQANAVAGQVGATAAHVARDPYAEQQAALGATEANRLLAARGNAWKTAVATVQNQQDEVRLAADQHLDATVRTEDYEARATAAGQVAAGQRERAGLTGRNRALEREAELLPGANATSPEAKRVRATGLAAINAELTAEKSSLTGHHGGSVVAGVDRGTAGAELLAGRAHAHEERQEAADIDATRRRVNGGQAHQRVRGANKNPRLVGRAVGAAIGGPVGAIVGDAAGRIVGDTLGSVSNDRPHAGGSAQGGDGSAAVVQKLEQIGRMLGDFLGRSTHSSAVMRGP